MKLVYTKPELRILNTSNCLKRATIQIQGLPQGKAASLGNSIRRNLLHHIPGLAPVAMKIIGADQEYRPIKGLVNDTSDIAMAVKNLKIAAVQTHLDTKPSGETYTTEIVPGEVIMEIKRKYSFEEIKFGDFKLAKDNAEGIRVEVLNPDEVLTYVGVKDVDVYIRVLFQRGVGYAGYNVANKADSIDSTFLDDSILLDSLYSPIKNATFHVKEEIQADKSVGVEQFGEGIVSNADSKTKDLLSFIPGLSPAAVNVEVLGDMEEVPQELLDSIKKVRIAACKDGTVPENIVLELKGDFVHEVRFGDLELSSMTPDIQFAILNPDVCLFDIGDKPVPIDLKLIFNRDVSYSGYSSALLKREGNELFKDAIALDTLYSPVEEMRYNVIKQAPTKTTETLEIMIETDGSILPVNALIQALKSERSDCNMLIDLLTPWETELSTAQDVARLTLDRNDEVSAFATKVTLDESEASTNYARPNEISWASDLEVLGLPTALYDALKDAGHNTLEDMKKDWDAIKNKEQIIHYLKLANIDVEEYPDLIYKD